MKTRQIKARIFLDFDIAVPAELPGPPSAQVVLEGVRNSIEQMLRDHGMNNDCCRASVSGCELIEDAAPLSTTGN